MLTFDTYSQTLQKKTFAGFSFEGVKTGSHGFVDIDNDGDLDLVIAGDSSKSRNFSLYINERGTGFSDFWASSTVTGAQRKVNDATRDVALIPNYADSIARAFIASDSVIKSNNPTQKVVLASEATRIYGYLEDPSISNSVNSFFNLDTLRNRYSRDSNIVAIENDIHFYERSALIRQNTIIDSINSSTLSPLFTDGFQNASVFLGDIENDGYVDLVVLGSAPNGLRVYKNNNGILEKNSYGLLPDNLNLPTDDNVVAAPIINANFGDYDNDGDLDGFVNWSASLLGVSKKIESDIYQNRGIGNSPKVIKSIQPKLGEGSNSIGDYDNDGFIDYFLAGKDSLGNLQANLYQNVNNDVYVAIDTVVGDSIFYMGNQVVNDTIIINAGYRKFQAEGGRPLTIHNNSIDSLRTYNDTVIFVDTTVFRGFQQKQSLVGYFNGTSQFIDVDNDGDLDLFTAGQTRTSTMARLYYNEDGFLKENSDSTSFMGVKNAVSAYGDYDNDGDLDIFLAGITAGSSNFSAIYKNTDGKFSSTYTFLRNTLKVESASFVDTDKDNDLDIFVTGTANGEGVSELYVNNNTTPNVKPTTPTGLKSVVIDSNKVFFTWNLSTDTKTPTLGITYNIYVGSSATLNRDSIRNSHSITTSGPNNGFRKINKLGDIRDNLYSIENLNPGVYVWNVQAIDGSLAASTWALEQTFTITRSRKQYPNIAFTTPDITKFVTDAPFTLSTTNSSTLPISSISYSIADPQIATINGATVTPKKAGITRITALIAETSNYYGSLAFASLEIRKSTQTISFGVLANKTFGEDPFVLQATSSVSLPVVFSASSSLVTINSNTVTINGSGTVSITAYNSGDNNYLEASTSQILTIDDAINNPNKTTPTLTFSDVPHLTIGNIYTLVATSNSPVAIIFTSSDTNKLSIVGNTATAKMRGIVSITAAQGGNNQFNSISVTQSIVIIDPTIPIPNLTFSAIPNITIGQNYNLIATSNSSVVITFTTSNTKIATVSGNILTGVGTGTAIITAVQNGNEMFNAASSLQNVTVVSTGTSTQQPLTSISKENKDIAIYPNPSSHFISIHAGKAGNGVKTYSLVNIKGEEVLKGIFTVSTSVDVRYQKTGTYLLTIVDAEGNILQQSHVIISQ
ncbi:MAG: T9SS type A sorting domain-containing protein [Chitinophagaceae bacterium]|nr:T9SS type A sorting domain-containing protein [Chitinophagaceae bacterium]